jgi:hypothetical protein
MHKLVSVCLLLTTNALRKCLLSLVSAEFLLTLTNLFIVLGLRDAIRKAEAANAAKEAAAASSSSAEVEKQPVAAQD